MNIREGNKKDLEVIETLVAAYHQFEGIESTYEFRIESITNLLENTEYGRIWVIELDSNVIGYLAICYGYSIEFGGRDAFIDEFYIQEKYRGKGLGKTILNEIKENEKMVGICALHLEVAHNNIKAKSLYGNSGFQSRDKYQLMTAMLLNSKA